MKRLKIKSHQTIEELRKELRKTKDGRYALRIRCIILKKEGRITKEIQEELLISRDTISRWIRNYNERGLEGLKTKKPRGRKLKMG